MRISYDREVDALYICFKETTVTTKHLEDGIALDYDEEDRLAGIEILDARKRIELGIIPIPAEEVCSTIQGKVIYREDINTPTIDEWKDLS